VTTHESPSNEPEDLMDVIVYGEARVGDEMDEIKESGVCAITQLSQTLHVNMGESRIACGNDLGIDLLKAYHSRGEKSSLYEDQITELKKKNAILEKKSAELEKKNAELETQVEIQSNIRSRFFSVYKRDFLSEYAGDIIEKDNGDAHDGNAKLNTIMYQNGIRSDGHIFKEIYGVKWDYVLKIRT
jgi:hypothetical protein